jgi:hypothetical protein
MSDHKVGDLYKIIEISGKQFEIRYGYYEEFEAGRTDPLPIYPDFRREPVYNDNGEPFVTSMQDVCSHFRGETVDGFCIECPYYSHGDELIGICTNKKNRSKGRS